ncbi:MAG: hypothetical protein HKN91_12280 [Acidimicrobiia bacterium]|nr:hypothetical protein [Acidimicrobiia bacterium]
MTARTIASRDAHDTQTRLERGTTYRATTTAGEATGEYLGMEAPHGDLAIMLRDTSRGVHSIEVDDVTSIERLAA